MTDATPFTDLLRIALDESSDQVYVVDAESGRILDANQGSLRALGYTRAELLALHTFDIERQLRPDNSGAVAKRLDANYREVILRSTHRRKDGSTFEARIHQRQVVVEGHTLVLRFVRDITAQLVLEEQLRESQRHYESLIRNLPGVVHRCLLDPPGTTLFMDDRIEELTGVPADDFVEGRRVLDDFVSSDDREVVANAWREVATKGGNYDITLTFRRIDGEERVVREVGHVVRGGPGEPATVEGIFFDVTERAEQERVLREAFDAEHHRFEQVVAASRQVVYEIDYETRLVVFSGPIEEVFGWPAGDGTLSLAAWHRQIHPDDLPGVLQVAERTVSSGTLYESEFRVLHRDGRFRWVWDRSLFDTDVEGRPVRAIGVVQDVTSRKELEAQMSSAQRMETVGALAAGLAHDVNNYLTTILGNVEFALMQSSEEEHPELADARDAAVGCAELVRKLLAFARPQQAQRERLDPGPLIADTARMLQRLAGPGIELVAVANDSAPAIHADRIQVQQLLMNLVANAREAMRGQGRIGIEASRAMSPRDGTLRAYLCLAVTDDGPGVAPEVRHRIFEPYFTTRPFGEGTGLGLSIVHGIVSAHAGWVEVESEPGAGATFRAYFPAE